MEPAEQISEEWSSLSGVYTVEETDLIMNQLLGNCSVPEQFYESTENINTFYFPAQVPSTNSMCFFQGSSSTADSGKYVFPTKNGGNYSNNSVTNSSHVSIGFSLHGNDSKLMNENTDEELGFDTGREVLADMNLQAHKEREILVSEQEKDKTRSLGKSEKRSRSSFEVPKNKRNVKFKNNPKPASISNNTEEDTLNNICCSDSNASQELHGGASSNLSLKDSTALKLTAKSRSSRDPATDPQSTYARRRRERINERLRILQNLVPNGTKVDISTMLEEAVQYVKFLQLQIKVLSSDDMWMYAPIAYNGMNIGQQLNINATKQPNKCLA